MTGRPGLRKVAMAVLATVMVQLIVAAALGIVLQATGISEVLVRRVAAQHSPPAEVDWSCRIQLGVFSIGSALADIPADWPVDHGGEWGMEVVLVVGIPVWASEPTAEVYE